jgi:hypothetical protein
MEEKDSNESNEETRARGVKRSTDIEIAEVSASKKKAYEEADGRGPRARGCGKFI